MAPSPPLSLYHGAQVHVSICQHINCDEDGNKKKKKMMYTLKQLSSCRFLPPSNPFSSELIILSIPFPLIEFLYRKQSANPPAPAVVWSRSFSVIKGGREHTKRGGRGKANRSLARSGPPRILLLGVAQSMCVQADVAVLLFQSPPLRPTATRSPQRLLSPPLSHLADAAERGKRRT